MEGRDKKTYGVIFDLDGTLLESAPAIMVVGNAFLAELGLAPISLEETRAFIGGGAKEFVRLLLGSRAALDEEHFAAQYARFESIYHSASPALNKPFPGVGSVLDALLEGGYALALCTNKPLQPTLSILEHFQWHKYFPVVVAGDTLPVRKPNPAPLLKAAQDLGCEDFLFVGDSEIDAQTALAVGCSFALFSGGYHKGPIGEIPRSFVFDDYESLLGDVVRSRNAQR